MLTNGETVVKETRDENKRNVNHDFIDSNIEINDLPYSKNKYEEVLWKKSCNMDILYEAIFQSQ